MCSFCYTFFFRKMDLKEELIDNKKCIFIEEYKLMFFNVYKFVSIDDKEVIFALKKDNKYERIQNKFFVQLLFKNFEYKIKTDICERKND